MENEALIKRLANAVIEGNEEDAKSAAEEALKNKMDPVHAIERGLAAGMKEVGERFGRGEFFLTQLMLAADAMNAGVKVLVQQIPGKKASRVGTVVIGTVQSDIHSIGKNLVATLLSASGFDVHDVGVDVKAMDFVKKAEEVNADIIAASALMSVTLPFAKDITAILEGKGVRKKYKVIVGGGAVSKEFADKIGADGYGKNAVEAVQVAQEVLKK
jgi:corrinoid protein of di/trimethylamine methyltransferase